MIVERAVFPSVEMVEWERQELPREIGPTAILLETLSSLISAGTELAVYAGTHIGYTLPNAVFPKLPHYPGYASLGRVVAVGDAVEHVKPGDRLMAEVPHATHSLIDAEDENYVKVPAQIADHIAPLIRMAEIALTAIRLAPIQLGDTAAVIGLGLVGQLTAQLYRLSGSNPTIGIDLIPERLAVAASNGLNTLPAGNGDLETKVERLLGGRRPDVVVEATGNPIVLSQCLQLAKTGGRVLALGSPRGKVELDVYSHIHRKGIELIGAHEFANRYENTPAHWTQRRNLKLLTDLFGDGRLQGHNLISHVIKPAELPTIYGQIHRNPERYLGVVIDWTGQSNS